MKTEHATMALHSQSAGNSSALVHSLSKALDEVWAEAREKGKGTTYVNTHPLVVMMVTQLAHLAELGISNQDAYSVAYGIVNDTLNEAN